MLYLDLNKLNLSEKAGTETLVKWQFVFCHRKAQLLWVNLEKYNKVSHLNKNTSPKTNESESESEWESESSSLAISKTFKTFKTRK